jgi:hypothetical protein
MLDNAYLDKSLPPHEAQVMTIWWCNTPEFAGSRPLRQRFKQDFPSRN